MFHHLRCAHTRDERRAPRSAPLPQLSRPDMAAFAPKVLATAGAGVAALLGLGYVGSKARPSSTVGANVPVDEEMFPAGYIVNSKQAHAEHLDESGIRRRATTTTTTTTTAAAPRDRATNAPLLPNSRADELARMSVRDAEIARSRQKDAQEAGASAAAAGE